MEYVQLCRFCGHINPEEETAWCANCRSFSGLTTVLQAEGERISRRMRRSYWLNRLLRLSLVLVPVSSLVVWGLWGYLDLAFNPPEATTGISVNVAPQSWAQARRTPQNTGSTPEQAPIPEEVRWTHATSRPIISSPAVTSDRVYLTNEGGLTVALDRATGEVVWEYHSGLPSSSAPAVAGDLVFFTLRPGFIVALDQHTGAPRWEKKIEDPILTSPIVEDGTLYVGAADSKLYALDAATGQERWTFASNDWITSEAAVDDGLVVTTSQGSRVHIVSTKTGRQRLVYDTGRRRSAPGGAAVQDDLVYFGSFGGRVWAIDLRARTYPWDRPILFLKTNLFVWGVSGSPPVQRGSVWATNLDGDITRPPAVANDTVYAATEQGQVAALDRTSGAERWSSQLDSEITAAPTVAGDTLLIGTEEGTVFGLDADSGATLWEFQTGGKITSSPVVAGRTIYISSHDGKLYAVGGAE